MRWELLAACGLLGGFMVGCGGSSPFPQPPAPQQPQQVIVNPAGPPVVLEASLADKSEEVRTKRLAELNQLHTEWFGVIRNYKEWHAKITAERQAAVEELEGRIAAARDDHSKAAQAIGPLADNLAAAKAALEAATKATKAADELTIKPHYEYANATKEHLGRVGNWESLLSAYAAKSATRDAAQDALDVAKEASRSTAYNLNLLDREPTVAEQEALRLLIVEAEAKREAFAEAEEDAVEAMEDLAEWRDAIDTWARETPPVTTPEDKARPAIAATASAHTKAIRTFLDLWSKRQSSMAAIDAANLKLASTSALLDAAEDAERDAKKAYRVAVARYEQINDKVKGEETARSMGANVQPDYAARDAARYTRDAAKQVADAAEAEKKKAKSARSDAFKLKNAATAHLKSLDKKETAERTAMAATAQQLAEDIKPWLAEAEAANANLTVAQAFETTMQAAHDAAGDALNAERAHVDGKRSTLNARIAERSQFMTPAPKLEAQTLEDFSAAISSAFQRRLSGDAVREFRVRKFTIPVWPGREQAVEVYQRVWLAVTESIDGSRQ